MSTWSDDGKTHGHLRFKNMDLPGSAPTIGIARIDSLQSLLGAYRLPASSPFVNRGVDLKATLGIDPGEHDFWCNPISNRIGN